MSHQESKIDIQKLLPIFKQETDDVTLFLVLLDRQINVPEHLWVSYLLNVLPSTNSTFIASEKEENSPDFSLIKVYF